MFTTSVNIPPSAKKINHNSKLITLGSCFSEHIGNRLKNACFLVDSNPFGVLFNPVSIKNSLIDLLDNKCFTKEDLFLNGSLWSSFSHSTLFSSTDADICLNNINSRVSAAHNQLLAADFLLITFGTAWVYELKETGEIVSNCHKLPAEKFIRRRLSVEEIISTYTDLLGKIKQINPKLELIFTVSPVRHWKDGAQENNISKGILHIAIDALCKQGDFVQYFPAYEIQLDELRDYRYYAEDMVHPSDVAVNYIWERFSASYFSADTMGIIKQVEKYNNQQRHRPIHQESKAYVMFKRNTEKERGELIRTYPFLIDRL
jgi:lysophospholipase L1-like esterase